MIFEIYTAGTGYFLEKVFNAIRLVMGGDGFVWLLKLSVIITFVTLIAKSVFDFNPKSLIHYFIKVTLITGILVAPVANVHINDTLPNQYGMKEGLRKIDKVPIGLAAMSSLTSTFMNWVGDKYEESFSAVMPNESYDKMGVLFGSKIVADTLKARAVDPSIKSAFGSFLEECIIPDIDYGYTRKNGYIEKDLLEAEDMLGFLKERTSRASLIPYTDAIRGLNKKNYSTEVGGQYITCNRVAHILSDAVEAETNIRMPALAKGFFAKFFPSASPADYEGAFSNALSDSYGKFLKSSRSAKDTIMQAVAINSVNDSIENAYSKVITRNTTKTYFGSMADMASRFILNIKAMFEIIIHGLFPIAVILMLGPGGFEVFKNYFCSMIYLQLWIPIYAILFTVYSADYAVANVDALTWASIGKLQAINGEISELSGYMLMFVPVIAGLALKMGLSSLGSLSSAMFSAPQQEAMRVARDSVQGTYTLGNTSIDTHSHNNLSANKHNDNYEHLTGMSSINSAMGSRIDEFAGGNRAISMATGVSNAGGLINIDWATHIGKRIDNSIASNKSQIERASSDYIESTTNAQYKALGYNETFNKGTASYKDFTKNLSTEDRIAFETSSSIIDKTAADFGISKDNAMKLLAAANAGILFEKVGPSIGLNAGADMSKVASVKKAYDHLYGSEDAKRYAESIGKVDSFIKSTSSKEHTGQDQALVDSIRQDLNEAQTATISKQKAEQALEANNAQKAAYLDKSQRINQNFTPRFIKWLENKVGIEEMESTIHQNDPYTINSLTTKFLKDNALGYTGSSVKYMPTDIDGDPELNYLYLQAGGKLMPKDASDQNDTFIDQAIEGKNPTQPNVVMTTKGNNDGKSNDNEKDQPIKNEPALTALGSNLKNDYKSNMSDVKKLNENHKNDRIKEINKRSEKIKGETTEAKDEDGNFIGYKFTSGYDGIKFAKKIHQEVNQSKVNDEYDIDTKLDSKTTELKEKTSIVKEHQEKIDSKVKGEVNQTALGGIANDVVEEISDATSNFMTGVKNTYYDITNQPDKKGAYIQRDKAPAEIKKDERLDIKRESKEKQNENLASQESNNAEASKDANKAKKKDGGVE